MNILVTSDLHYNIHRSRQPAAQLAEEICARPADALLIVGDVAGHDLNMLREGLKLFDRFPGRKFFVAGNHDIWTGPGGCSLTRLERELPAVCAETGFHPLDIEPATINGVGLVGSIGWYDYSFRPAHLNIPLRFYRAKIAPGAATRLQEYQHLVADLSDVPSAALHLGTRWMDGVHARLPMSDVDFCHYLAERLQRHLAWAAARCEHILVGLHHVPFWASVPRSEHPGWAFASAFLGSELFGETVLACPKVRYVLCGHTHRYHRTRCGHIECISVGSTYLAKRWEMICL